MAELVMFGQILEKETPAGVRAFRGVGCFSWIGWAQVSKALASYILNKQIFAMPNPLSVSPTFVTILPARRRL